MNAYRPYVVIASGGTGGHMMPADAMSSALIERGADVTLITDKRGDQFDNIMQDIDRVVLNTVSHVGGPIGKIRGLISIWKSARQVQKMFADRRPDVVVGFGGYPSMPVILAAKKMGIPFVLHEQNAVLGRVNKMYAESAAGVALSYENTVGVPDEAKIAVTGNPVRKIIEKLANIAYSVPMGAGDIRLFIIGGSQGARILSDVVPEALAKMDESIRSRLVVSHQARGEDMKRVQKAYHRADIRAEVSPYFEDVAGILLRCQLVISRAGASTLAELTTMARPAILVPLKIAANDHQRINASFIADEGAGWLLTEDEFTVDAVYTLVEKLCHDMGGLRKASEAMRECATLGAADHLADLVLGVAADAGEEE